jgi:hypothetical protein
LLFVTVDMRRRIKAGRTRLFDHRDTAMRVLSRSLDHHQTSGRPDRLALVMVQRLDRSKLFHVISFETPLDPSSKASAETVIRDPTNVSSSSPTQPMERGMREDNCPSALHDRRVVAICSDATVGLRREGEDRAMGWRAQRS